MARVTYRAVSLLRSRGFAWEDDQFGAVLLQPLHVGLQGLGRLVATAFVHRDANGASNLLVDASSLQ